MSKNSKKLALFMAFPSPPNTDLAYWKGFSIMEIEDESEINFLFVTSTVENKKNKAHQKRGNYYFEINPAFTRHKSSDKEGYSDDYKIILNFNPNEGSDYDIRFNISDQRFTQSYDTAKAYILSQSPNPGTYNNRIASKAVKPPTISAIKTIIMEQLKDISQLVANKGRGKKRAYFNTTEGILYFALARNNYAFPPQS